MRSGGKSFKCNGGSGGNLPRRVPGASSGGKKPPLVQLEVTSKNCLVAAIALVGSVLSLAGVVTYGVYALVVAVV
jgi:hypothetical protein